MSFAPLGDQAWLIYLPDEATAADVAVALRQSSTDWLVDVVPAYASVGVFYDPERAAMMQVRTWLESFVKECTTTARPAIQLGKLVTIPVCYELAQDMSRIIEHTGLASDEIVSLHLSEEYTVYAIGFVPGFPYLGYLPEPLRGVGRLPSPRTRVEPGSVGLTGKQTGIYPLARPGGWNLIGRTPVQLVDLASEYFPLRVGDRVRFVRIDESEFQRRLGERL